MSNDSKSMKELYKVIVSLGSVEDCEAFFADLCTPNEVAAMAQRLEAAKLLMAGKTYEEIIAITDISSATLSRVSRCIKYGKGYKKVIK